VPLLQQPTHQRSQPLAHSKVEPCTCVCVCVSRHTGHDGGCLTAHSRNTGRRFQLKMGLTPNRPGMRRGRQRQGRLAAGHTCTPWKMPCMVAASSGGARRLLRQPHSHTQSVAGTHAHGRMPQVTPVRVHSVPAPALPVTC
jgi:hypothetical protein